MDQPDVLHVLFHHRADLGDDAGHVDAAGLEVAAAGVEYGFQLFHDEGDVAALAEHGGEDAGERHDPLEVIHVLRVDEDLEGAALLVLGAGVEHDVVDGDVQRVLEQRRLDLEGGADQGFRPLDTLVHLDHFGLLGRGRGGLLCAAGRIGNLVLGLDHVVAGDLLVDLDCHGIRFFAGRAAMAATCDMKNHPARRDAGPDGGTAYFFLLAVDLLAALGAAFFLLADFFAAAFFGAALRAAAFLGAAFFAAAFFLGAAFLVAAFFFGAAFFAAAFFFGAAFFGAAFFTAALRRAGAFFAGAAAGAAGATSGSTGSTTAGASAAAGLLFDSSSLSMDITGVPLR